jgi:hypothetical protein
MAMPAFCQWTCNCGAGTETFRIDGAIDGLPVELMEFSVEDEGEADGADTDGSEEESTRDPDA